MRPERQARIEAAFTRRAAEGLSLAAITNKLIYDEVKGKKSDVSTIGAVWRAQQRTAQATNGAVAVLGPPDTAPEETPVPEVPASPTAPRLHRLAQERQTLVREIEGLQRRLQQVSQEEQQARFAERRAREALHVATRRAQQAPPHAQRAAFEAEAACRRALAALIGEAAASRASPV